METFTLDPRCWRIGRIFWPQSVASVHRSHRSLGHVGRTCRLASRDSRHRGGGRRGLWRSCQPIRAQEAHERHTITATVTDGGIDGSAATVVQARWPVAAGERTAALERTTAAKVGDRIKIWVDKDGNPVAPPTPTWRAVGDAVGTALAILLSVGFWMTLLVTGVRSRLDRARDAEWEREIRCLQEDGGRAFQH